MSRTFLQKILGGIKELEYFYNIPCLTGSLAKWKVYIDEELEARMEYLKLNKDNLTEEECREYYGHLGENAIIQRLMKCCQPMCIINNLEVKYNDIKIQNDLIVVMNNAIIIIECKNWSGYFKVDEFGNFIKIKKFDSEVKDFIDTYHGVFSPVSQVMEHYNLIKCIIDETLYQEFYDDKIKCIHSLTPLVVMGNEKVVIDLANAPQDMKDKVIKFDQVYRYIEQFIDNDRFCFTDHEIIEISQKLISMDINTDEIMFI